MVRLLVCVTFLLVVLATHGNAYSAKDLMAELEKELEIAQKDRKEVKKNSLSSLDSLQDMKARLEELEKDLKAKRSRGGSNDENTKHMQDAMKKLDAELERHSKRQASKKSASSLSFDELMDDIRETGNTRDDLKNKFYNIIGYKQSSQDDIDQHFKRAYLEGSLGSILDQIRNSKRGSQKDEIFRREDSECKDVRSDCARLKSYCENYREKLEGACDKTCQYCRECKNSGAISDEMCENLRKESRTNPQGLDYCFMDGYTDRMRNICYKSCGYCKAPAPPKCSETQYKCCWDDVTTKVDNAGSNCPACVDQYKYACTTFKEDCSSRYKPGEFMHTYCPETCNLCGGGCLNERGFDEYCAFWKTDLNWCVENEDKMRHYCNKECGFC